MPLSEPEPPPCSEELPESEEVLEELSLEEELGEVWDEEDV